jgi:hypothetical protein
MMMSRTSIGMQSALRRAVEAIARRIVIVVRVAAAVAVVDVPVAAVAAEGVPAVAVAAAVVDTVAVMAVPGASFFWRQKKPRS